MFNNVKIAFFDIDGTLANDDKIISNKSKTALLKLKEKGTILVLSSGRWDTYMLDFNKDLNIIDYIIANNGASIIDVKNKKVLYEDILNTDEINLIEKYILNKNLNATYNGLYKQFKPGEIIDTSIYQIIIECNTKEEVSNFIKYIDTIPTSKIGYVSAAYYKDKIVNTYSINVNINKTNKGNSISYLLNKLNIEKKYSICFGDNISDLPMFNACGIKVAVDNALPELKEHADYITLSNNDDGVAHFINNNLI